MAGKGKLVRDHIPEIIRASGGTPITRLLNANEQREALFDKLLEESEELRCATTRAEQTKELADVLEVLRSLAANHDIDWSAVEGAATSKRQERGGFDLGIWLADPGDQ